MPRKIEEENILVEKTSPRRGRPKKILTEEELAAKSIPKKLGRPRKNPIADKNSNEEKIPKKLGRPKKILNEENSLQKKSNAPKVDDIVRKVELDYKSDGHEKIFALDIGTRSIIGIVAEKNADGQLSIIATRREEHKTRAMLDGQIHDVPQVAAVINRVRDSLAEEVGELKSAAVAAAGRALYTMTAEAELEINGIVSENQQSGLEFSAVQLAQSQLAAAHTVAEAANYYCVGFSVVSYELDGVRLKSLIGQRGKIAKAKVIATFLPRQVIDSMQSALDYSKLEMKALTLEPIAAINVLIPPTMRHLNLVLVDIGAGTSDVAITKNGSVIAYGMVPLAGDEITEALSQKFLLDFNVAEEVKRKAANGESAKFNDILGGSYDMTAEEIISSITDNIANLAEEIARTIFELNGNESPQAIMLVGGGALTPQLQKYVAEALDIPPARVAVRKPDVVEGVASIPKELCLPDAVTPLGILKIASGNMLHFLNVYVNGEEFSLFHFRDLTVRDALLSAGVQLKKFNGRPGLGLMVMIDGEKKVFAGSLGTLAKLNVDGEEATLDTPIKNHSQIKVERGEDGKTPELRLNDVAVAEPSFSVFINGKEELVTPKIMVNDEVSLPTRILKDGDEIKILTARTVGEVLRLVGYPPTGRKINYTLNGRKSHYTCSPEILMDDGEVKLTLPIHAGDNIEYIAHDSPKVSDIINISGIATSVNIFYEGKEFEIPTMANVDLTVNGRAANTNTLVEDGAEISYEKSENRTVTVSDALLAVNFQPPDPKSRMGFVIKVNGIPSDFADPIKQGDTLEVILKTPDGVELTSPDSIEIPVEKFEIKSPPKEEPTQEKSPRQKLTIQDFIRND